MSFTTRLTGTATKLITKYGMRATLTTTNTDGSTTVRTAMVADLGIVKHVLGDSGVAIGDHRLIIEAAGAPKDMDRIDTPDGLSRVLTNPILPIDPAGVPMAYEAYSRAG